MMVQKHLRFSVSWRDWDNTVMTLFRAKHQRCYNDELLSDHTKLRQIERRLETSLREDMELVVLEYAAVATGQLSDRQRQAGVDYVLEQGRHAPKEVPVS